MSGRQEAGMKALLKHPNIKHITPHKMVTRSLKYLTGKTLWSAQLEAGFKS